MNNNASNNSASTQTIREDCVETERDGATNFAVFLYDLWRKRKNNAIIKEDKTLLKNEEPINAN